MSNLFKVFILSAVILSEQRASIPIGIFLYDLNPVSVFLVAIIGSLIPSPFILLLFNQIYKWIGKYKTLKPIYNFIEKKLNRHTPKIERYKEIALIAFVAIPLPVTGVWTGSAIAAFLRLNKKKAFICILIGASISALILTLGCVLLPAFFKSLVE